MSGRLDVWSQVERRLRPTRPYYVRATQERASSTVRSTLMIPKDEAEVQHFLSAKSNMQLHADRMLDGRPAKAYK